MSLILNGNDHFKRDNYKVLDAVSTLYFGKWELPGKSGRRPNTAFVSAYRNIDYEVVEDPNREPRGTIDRYSFRFL